MNEEKTTYEQLVEENRLLRQKIQEFEKGKEDGSLIEEGSKLSHRRLQSLIDSSPDFFFLKDPDLRYLLVNDANARFFGRDKTDILGRTDVELMPEEAAIACRTSDQRAIHEKRTVITIEPVGDKFYETYKFPVLTDGKVVGVGGIVRDITKRRRIEKMLGEVEARYQLLFEHAPDGVVIVDPATAQFLEFNEAAHRQLGYSREEFALLGIPDIDAVESREETRKRIENVICEGRDDFETLHRTRQGEIRNVDVTAQMTEMSGQAVYHCVWRDITEQKRMQKALKAGEEKYRKIFEGASEGICQTTPEGGCLSVNPAFARMFGYVSPGEMIDSVRNIGEEHYVNPGDREEMVRILRESDRVEGCEVEVCRKDRSRLWISVNMHTVRDPSGNILYFEGTAEDITKRKRIEEELHRSNALYKTIFDNSCTSMVIIDEDTTIVLCNEEWTKLSGYSREETEGRKSWTEFIHEDDLNTMRKYHAERRVDPGNVPRQYEFRFIDRHGNVHSLVNVAAMIPGTRMSVAANLDITDLKQAEKALIESEEKYRSVAENSLVGLYILEDGLFRYVNRRLCEIIGYTYEELVDKRGPLEFVHPDDREWVGEIHRKRLAGEDTESQYDFRAIRKDGRIITFRLISSWTMHEGRRLIMGSLLDVTREKSLEEKLLQSQKMEALGTLAGGIAHDFNNILTALAGYGTLLQMKMDEADPLHIYVDQILSASGKAAQLTQSLLTFSRQRPIALSHVDINGIIRGTEKLLKRLLTEDIELKTVLSPGDITVMADPTQIDQILFNLATNARDAMPGGGTLTITTEAVELDEGFRHAHGYGEPGPYALISFSDTGLGMDKATQAHIFDPFFTTKEVGRGTGLGLSTVYGAVKQHNGYISVLSEPNAGTTFHIYLPGAMKAGREEGKAPIAVKGGKEIILIAEDNGAVRELMGKILTQYGYRTIEAVDGADALARFREAANIDLLVLDSVMPRMNGPETYNEIRKIRPGIKVIFTSGYTRDVFLDKGIEDGKFNFLQKPISPDAILQKVREVLDA